MNFYGSDGILIDTMEISDEIKRIKEWMKENEQWVIPEEEISFIQQNEEFNDDDFDEDIDEIVSYVSN